MTTPIIPVKLLTTNQILQGNRSTKYYIDVLDSNDTPKFRLDGVVEGRLDWIANAAVKGAASLTVKETSQTIDWLTDRFRPTMVIKGLPEQTYGVFLPSEAPDSWNGGHSWSVKLLDKTTIPDQDIITSTYVVAAGTVVTTEVSSLLTSAGVNNFAVSASTATLSDSLVWQPRTSKLKIINDLLSVINYFALYADLSGQVIAAPYLLPAGRPIKYEFLDGERSIYDPNFKRDLSTWRIPNRVVCTSMGNDTTEGLTASYDNNDPNSPYSIPRRGRVIGHPEEGIEIADQATLNAYTQRRLVELTTPVTSIEVQHAPIPGLTTNDVVRLRRVPAGIDARHTVAKTEINLRGEALATSTIREVVDL